MEPRTKVLAVNEALKKDILDQLGSTRVVVVEMRKTIRRGRADHDVL